ncbi:efflux transporter outer membrane subunit [Ramlibacter albus]|uniref:Efflux transporter outer membrane subunit n=1 Tax=Ramlibacter albus TaxID=2079448 RepID=A0A923M8B2_9BURK|nr:efflux transporter outer membrane subunit [Ramlibacter albus]MBC5765250.1 efflux transporter outer membrane subunit [Ramlibacter albus]
MKRWTIALAAALVAGTAGAQAQPAAPLPVQWYEALPHGGAKASLQQWWAQFEDPLLLRLVDAAQAASPDVAAAASRIAQSRASRTSAGAALLPSVDANLGAARGRSELQQPIANSGSAGLQWSWELDLFGGNRAGARAADARAVAADAGWHEARVAVAAEVAASYTQLRACEARLVQTQIDVTSREETARLTSASRQFGMQSPGNEALARASAAQARAGATQLMAQCSALVKSLVAMTGFDEVQLRTELAAATARLPRPAQIEVNDVPARALAQRPDLLAAERNVVAASADWDQSRARQWPRLVLQGNVGRAHAETSWSNASGSVWSFGPVSLVLPVFDGGQRKAQAEAARAKFDEAGVVYRAKLRQAVREVETALLSLHSTAGRAQDARIAAEGFRVSLQATDTRYRGGLASLFELEEARRSDVQSQISLIDLEQERVQAWINLYRALGGGWEAS